MRSGGGRDPRNHCSLSAPDTCGVGGEAREGRAHQTKVMAGGSLQRGEQKAQDPKKDPPRQGILFPTLLLI